MDLIYRDYSKQNIFFAGSKEEYTDLIKLGGKWKNKSKKGPGWIVPKNKEKELESLVKFRGIKNNSGSRTKQKKYVRKVSQSKDTPNESGLGGKNENDDSESEEGGLGGKNENDDSESEEGELGGKNENDDSESEEGELGGKNENDDSESEEGGLGGKNENDDSESEEGSDGDFESKNDSKSKESKNKLSPVVEESQSESDDSSDDSESDYYKSFSLPVDQEYATKEEYKDLREKMKRLAKALLKLEDKIKT